YVSSGNPADAAADDRDLPPGHVPSLQAYGLLPSRPAALTFQAYGPLFVATKGPDWRPDRFLATEYVPQRSLQVRLAELVPGRDQPLRPDVLAGLGDFPGPFCAEQQPGPEPGDRQHRGPAQHAGQRPGVVDVAHRLRGDRVDRPGQAGIEHGPQVDVEQVIQADPGQPLLAAAEPAAEARLEQRAEQAEHAAARRLHDAGADPDRPDARRGGQGGGVFPVGDHVGQEPLAAGTVLGQDLLAPI